jgi:hypothetical protein
VIRVSPETGSIRPREAMLCKVVIEAVGKPTYYDVDLVCEVLVLCPSSSGHFDPILYYIDRGLYRAETL